MAVSKKEGDYKLSNLAPVFPTFHGTHPIYGTDHINMHAIILVVTPLSHEFPHHLPMIFQTQKYALQPEVLWPPKGQKSRRPSTAENRPLRRKAPRLWLSAARI